LKPEWDEPQQDQQTGRLLYEPKNVRSRPKTTISSLKTLKTMNSWLPDVGSERRLDCMVQQRRCNVIQQTHESYPLRTSAVEPT